jgi:hypothetical protein
MTAHRPTGRGQDPAYMPTRSPESTTGVLRSAHVMWRFGHESTRSRTMADCACVTLDVQNDALVKLSVVNTPHPLPIGRTGGAGRRSRRLTSRTMHLQLVGLRHVGEPTGILVQTSGRDALSALLPASCVWSDGTSESAEENASARDVDLRSAAPPLHIVKKACSTHLRTAGNSSRAHRS